MPHRMERMERSAPDGACAGGQAAGEPQYCAIIVGAGFGGMGAAIALQRSGIEDFLILEREDDLGGTWHVNHYPGLAVDIASVTYSYSFEPNPYWSRLFAPGEELKAYAEHIARTYDLRRRMRMSTVVEGAAWDGDAGHWEVAATGPDGAERTLTARYLLTATGFLSQPQSPDIPGIGDFEGTVVHTAAWDHGADLRGKRIAVIGTGATAVQLIPELARDAAELTVYQRTPIWVVPKPDFPIPRPVQRLFALAPPVQKAARAANTAILEAMMVTAVLHYRRSRYLNAAAAALAKAHLRLQVPDAELRRKLTPAYSFGCKRPTFSNDYFRTFARDTVTLETGSIERMDASGIVTDDGRRTDVDVLVLATGFNLWEVNFPAIEVIGRGGRSLGKWWRDGRFQAYEGVSMPRFPNFLSLSSPYSYSGLSYFTTIEAQMRHIQRLFAGMRETGARTFEVTEEANTAFLDKVTGLLGDSVFYRGHCGGSHSYYFNQHGEAAILRPTSTADALRAAGRFPLGDYAFSP